MEQIVSFDLHSAGKLLCVDLKGRWFTIQKNECRRTESGRKGSEG